MLDTKRVILKAILLWELQIYDQEIYGVKKTEREGQHIAGKI